MSKKRAFVVDYEVTGTLHLSCFNSSQAELRAQQIINKAMADLDEISVYCEEFVAVPIDAHERYGMKGGR